MTPFTRSGSATAIPRGQEAPASGLKILDPDLEEVFGAARLTLGQLEPASGQHLELMDAVGGFDLGTGVEQPPIHAAAAARSVTGMPTVTLVSLTGSG